MFQCSLTYGTLLPSFIVNKKFPGIIVLSCNGMGKSPSPFRTLLQFQITGYSNLISITSSNVSYYQQKNIFIHLDSRPDIVQVDWYEEQRVVRVVGTATEVSLIYFTRSPN